MDLLPQEVIGEILKYLPFADLKRLRQTSRWLNEIVVHYIKDRERYRVINSIALKTLDQTERNFSALYFRYITYEFFILNWFCVHGSYITELSFTMDVFVRDFEIILIHCTALRSLTLSGNIPDSNYLDDLKIRCKSLEMLHLKSTNNIRDYDIFVYFQICPNIHTISLTDNYLLSHPIVHKRYYPDLDCITPSKDVFTYWFLTRTIESRAKQIRKINFDETDIVKAELDSILAIRDLRLETLHCGRRRINTSVLVERQPQIQNLTICGVTTDDIKLITSNMHSVEHLNLKKNVITVNATSDIQKLTHLKELNLSASNDYEFIHCIFSLKRLTSLDLSNNTFIENTFMHNISHTLSSLRVLKINHCIGVTDNGLMYISSLKELNVLQMCGCRLSMDCLPFIKLHLIRLLSFNLYDSMDIEMLSLEIKRLTSLDRIHLIINISGEHNHAYFGIPENVERDLRKCSTCIQQR